MGVTPWAALLQSSERNTMTNYNWTITKDIIGNGDDDATRGPGSCNMSKKEIVAHPDGQRFRMRDDDNELYYEGILVGGNGFEPLDDFGTPNAGCTSIEFWEKKNGAYRWCIL
jgi:hypothetical protein